ncbi:MAG: type II toxin-antitoxin system VapC family toxin [Patescibacteria group bacterium]
MGKMIGIDSSVLIYLWEKNPEFLTSARRILQTIERGDYCGVFSIIGIIEIFTGVKSQNRYDLVPIYRNLIKNFPNLIVAGITERVVDISSDLRAMYKLRTPDAIHIATAIDFGADEFITNDDALRKIKEIKITLLRSL